MIIIKPDAFERGLVGELLASFEINEEKVFNRMYSGTMTIENCRAHYAAHIGQPYYQGLVHHMTQGICLFVDTRMHWGIVRDISLQLRKHYGVEGPRNLIHASDSAETNVSETAYWFKGYP